MTTQTTSLCSSELLCGFHLTESKIQMSNSSMQGTTGSEPCPASLNFYSHSCFLTIHEHIITDAFSSDFSLPGTHIIKILPWLTSSHHSSVPAQQPQKTLLPSSLKNLLTIYHLTLLTTCITHLYLKAYFLFVHIFIECDNSPCSYFPDKTL